MFIRSTKADNALNIQGHYENYRNTDSAVVFQTPLPHTTTYTPLDITTNIGSKVRKSRQSVYYCTLNIYTGQPCLKVQHILCIFYILCVCVLG